MRVLPLKSAIATLLVAVVLLSTTTVHAATPRRVLLHRTNTLRENHDRREVRLVHRLTRLAQRNSRRMASRRTLLHSSKSPCREWGEVVGVGPSLRRVWRSFRHSPLHRRTILRAKWRRSGIGVVRSAGRWWITIMFCPA